MIKKNLILLFVLILHAKSDAKSLVLVSFGVLTNICQEIGQDDFILQNINTQGSDEHSFEPRPEFMKNLKKSKALVLNGLGYEPWFEALKKSYSGQVLIASRGIVALSAADPHAWLDPLNGIIYAENVMNLFAQLEPSKKELFKSRYENYKKKLSRLSADAKIQFRKLDKRKVVTSHSSFNYLAKALDLEFYSPQGISTDHEASAKDLKRVIEIIRNDNIQALFTEYGVPSGLVETISRETRVKISGTLYSDKLSEPAGPANSYLNLLKHDLDVLHQALK